MITLSVLILMSIMLICVGVLVLSVGGTIFFILFSDLIVVVFIVWFLFFRSKRKKVKSPKKK